jgi:redox-regulated HSP33 family molecular chaperone
MNAKALYLTRDIAIKCTTRCGMYRVVAANTTNLLRETVRRHGLLPADGGGATVPQTGHVISLTNMAASFLDAEERVRVEYCAPSATPTCESLAVGEARAFVGDASTTAMHGALRVQRVLYGRMKPGESVTIAPNVPADDHNLTLHAQHFFQQSDGIPTAVFFATALDPAAADGIAYNCGVMVQPIAISMERDNAVPPPIARLQRGFWQLSHDHVILDENDAEVTSSAAPLGTAALVADSRRAMHARFAEGYMCHDLLGMATGDWSGAASVMKKARHLGGDVASAQTPAPSILGGSAASPALELDPELTARTPLDYYCRCSKAGFVKALRLMGPEQCREHHAARPALPFVCPFCAKEDTMTPEDWVEVFA